MPLGIISQDEFESELSNCNSDSLNKPASINPRAPELINDTNETVPQVVTIPQSEARGRGETHTQVPSALRKVIGETSAINGRRDALDLADMFDIKPSSVSAYAQGAHSTATINEPNKDTLSHINASKLRVTKRAGRKLNLALSYITDEKLSEAKVGEIASVVKAMSGVIKDMEPSDNNDKNKSNIPFVVFAPIIRNENTFEVVHAKDDY